MDNYSSPLVSIQNQIDGIRSDIYGLNTGLTNIGVLLQNDRTAEKIRLRDEEQQERILAQQQVKVGKETAIERRVTDSIAVPIQKVERKLTSTFSGISDALKTLFFGTISTLGIRSLGFTSTILRSTINGTKSLIANSLRLVTGALSSISSGFGFVYRSVTGLTKKVSDIAFRLVNSPIKAISEGFKSLFNIGRGGASAVGSAGEVSGAALSGFGKLFRGLVGPAAAVGVDIATGEKPEKAVVGGVGGAAAGALTGAAAGSVFGPPGTLIGGIGGYMLGSSASKDIYEKVKGGDMKFTMPSTNLNVDIGKTFGEGSKALMGGITGMFDKPEPKKVSAPLTTFESTKDSIVDQSGASAVPLQVQPSKPPTKKKDLAPLDQKTDVIYTSTVAQQEQQQPVMTGPEEVPFISSSNPDNFYVLYSQLNYNVVM